MNSVPPGKEYFAVSVGPEVTVRHPDRAPYTELAKQDGVILFSGTAPQRGLNFSLRAGSLVYHNQMSTLGGPEPTPQVGTAGTLTQRPWDLQLPWSQARWHPGEDISWQGYRVNQDWIGGLPHWDYDTGSCDANGGDYDPICDYGPFDVYAPCIENPMESSTWNLHSAFNLQLARGLYQVSKVRPSFSGHLDGECPNRFREPWFQGEAANPAFNVELTLPDGHQERIAKDYFPTFHNIYTFEKLLLDGGRLEVDFERSATWPRRDGDKGAGAGTVMAETVRDEYGNVVYFDRVPKYGWETDFKTPPKSEEHHKLSDPQFSKLPETYNPRPHAWRLPHKRMRTVQLFNANDWDDDPDWRGEPDWIIAFVYEHPESDRISDVDYPNPDPEDDTWDGWKEYKSLYSHLPQDEWDFGRLPELNDETTLLTVQAYKGEHANAAAFNGEQFVDDYSVWGTPVENATAEDHERVHEGYGPNDDGFTDYSGPFVNDASDPPGDENEDGCPGDCGIDDDGDGLIDEDSNGYLPYLLVEGVDCHPCQNALAYPEEGEEQPDCAYDGGELQQTHDAQAAGECKNPLYWAVRDSADPSEGTWWPEAYPNDLFVSYDDDEDGLVDEDTGHDPFLVHMRAADGSCASGRWPYIPKDATLPRDGQDYEDCVRPLEAQDDPWSYQVQYVYARSNPFWLLKGRDGDGDAVNHADGPQYYYHPPFAEPHSDDNGDDLITAGEYVDINGNGDWDQYVGDSSDPNLPNVHPDCVPSPDFRGAAGSTSDGEGKPQKPSDIHLIKRIVRMRDEVQSGNGQTHLNNNFVEQVWLYRYNDAGFLKAVFDPDAVQAILKADPDDDIEKPDDILQYADTHPVAETPLIMYASQWYTYYMPFYETDDGIPPCYERLPYGDNDCADMDPNNPFHYYAPNACDGQRLWSSNFQEEMHVDPDCSPFLREDCGWCLARYACNGGEPCTGTACDCAGGYGKDELAQMGISGAQPRMRKYLIKTARVRGNDGEMHLYRFDYLGAANSVYSDSERITSYADPHNITIVDELAQQTNDEFGAAPQDLNDFYIYEDDFRITLDPQETRDDYPTSQLFSASRHYLYMPVKVKKRRVVVMNYYGIAISDREILTPGYDGDQSSLVDNQRYELLNTRGQAKHIYDLSWVATLRENGGDMLVNGIDEAQAMGRVFTEFFGGEDGWHSVLKGVAWGAAGGNLYNQQCETPEILNDVPVQRVVPEDVSVISATEHFNRGTTEDPLYDMPAIEAAFYDETMLGVGAFDYTNDPDATSFLFDPAGTLGTSTCTSGSGDPLANIDLTNQEPTRVDLPDASNEDDGRSQVHYHYEFHDPLEKSRLKIKYRWEEAVSTTSGGTGNVALQVWFFDQHGRIRLFGQGGGTSGEVPPKPTGAFVTTYTGYDDYGRAYLQIEGFNVLEFEELFGEAPELGGVSFQNDVKSVFTSDSVTYEPQNRITYSKYNDLGVLVSRCVGTAENDQFSLIDDVPVTSNGWADLVRTDFKLLANRVITHEEEDHAVPVWEDPYTYFLTYNHVVTDDDDDDIVHGTTTVDIMDKGGRPIEQRIIARHPDAETSGKITDFGWAVSLEDYSHDGALTSDWGVDTLDNLDLPDGHCEGSGGTQGACGTQDATDGTVTALFDDGDAFSPCFPGQSVDNNAGSCQPGSGENTTWPPEPQDQIVTLARNFKLYKQNSTLKPTHDLVYRDFSAAPPQNENWEEDPRAVVREYMYDLEDRIARSVEPDGTVSRFLFDPKRRPTKVFRGSVDSCSSWFPPTPEDGSSYGDGDDDMLLVEHRLYNDGTDDCEHSPTVGLEGCTTVPSNENFPKNAGKLVRVRRYVDNAEDCEGSYNDETSSRDTQYEYDWRGRPVIMREIADGFDGTSTVVSVNTTLYDNLDRPILQASWAPQTEPDVQTLETWMNKADPVQSPPEDANVPLTLSQTFYDERGRVFEQRTYDTGFAWSEIPNQYTYSRTYRDDLDRAIVVESPTGVTLNKYDTLGRTIEKSHWSEGNSTGTGSPVDPNGFDGTELTCTQTEYDAFGNALRIVHYDRRDTGETGAITEKLEFTEDYRFDDAGFEPAESNAIITYQYNWYDDAKRLATTADYGTAADHGFANAALPDYCEPTWDEADERYEAATGADCSGSIAPTNAIVSRMGYDVAGRQIWTQDPMGRVTRTWYDMLGRTLLTAENWKDTEALDHDGESINGNSHAGPIRYTAQHFTRGGLLDAMVAILPSDASTSDTFTPDIKPESIEWNEDPNEDYGAGDNVTIDTTEAVDLQVTRYKYGADVLEATYADAGSRAAVSTGPNLVSQIQYPDPDTGQASEQNAISFRYTISGKPAQRTDQRGVTLNFDYGLFNEYADSTPFDKLSRIEAIVPEPAPDHYYGHSDRWSFAYDTRGRLEKVKSLDGESVRSETTLTYTSMDRLASESTMSPFAGPTNGVSYEWEWADDDRYRLQKITYPSGKTFKYEYGAEDSVEDTISRMTGMTEVDENDNDVLSVVDYTHTGGGRAITKEWGADAVTLDYRSTWTDRDGNTHAGWDTFGRVTRLAFENAAGPLHEYEYGYDRSGNRQYARIVQRNRPNTHSYLYGYEPLNRLQYAEEGTLNTDNDAMALVGAVGQHWQLDLLGNLAGGDNDDSFVRYTGIDGMPGYSQSDNATHTEHHDTNAVNEIETRNVDADGTGGASPVTETLAFDDAGNLINNDGGTPADDTDDVEYFYDAFNRVTHVENHDSAVDDVTYAYDALGRRAYREVDGDEAHYFYDGNRVIAAIPVDGDPQEYVYGLDYIDELVAMYDDGKSAARHFILQDANYNVVAVTDESGNLLQQYRYEPYGLRSGVDDGNGDPISDESLVLVPQGFQGLWWDPVTDLYHMRNREFDPTLQRALQRDPNQTALILNSAMLQNAQTPMAFVSSSAGGQYTDGMGLYTFARNNPFTYTDPSGLTAEVPENHITPTYLGGSEDGPRISTVFDDHKKFHRALNREGWPSQEHGQHLADEFWGKKPLSKDRGRYKAGTTMTHRRRQRVLMIALKRAGFHGSDRKLKRLVRQSLMEGDGIRKRTNGNHGKGTLYHYSEFRRTHGWKRQNGQLVKVKFRGPKISARRIAGAGAIGGAIFLASLPNNAAAGYYRELTLLTQQVRRQTEGPSLFQEVEALAIIKDFNDELMGNVFTTYAGWDAWRWGFDLD